MENNRDVLVVEDDPAINALLCRLLHIQGLAYRSAMDGQTAVKEAQSHVPALVLLDVMLPDADGFEVCRRLKADEHTADVPVIMITALNDDQSRQRGLACGAAEYITKPFSPDVLLAAIEQYTHGKT